MIFIKWSSCCDIKNHCAVVGNCCAAFLRHMRGRAAAQLRGNIGTYTVAAPARLLHPPWSVGISQYAVLAPTFVGRESGVCDTNIPHYNPFVVMVITDGCLHRACYLFITDWALRPSLYRSVTQSVVFDGALHVCSCVQYTRQHISETIRAVFTNMFCTCYLWITSDGVAICT